MITYIAKNIPSSGFTGLPGVNWSVDIQDYNGVVTGKSPITPVSNQIVVGGTGAYLITAVCYDANGSEIANAYGSNPISGATYACDFSQGYSGSITLISGPSGDGGATLPPSTCQFSQCVAMCLNFIWKIFGKKTRFMAVGKMASST